MPGGLKRNKRTSLERKLVAAAQDMGTPQKPMACSEQTALAKCVAPTHRGGSLAA
jgi:hypothetical protein